MKMTEIFGVTAQTLRNWDKSGKLKPHPTSPNGYRYYSEEDFNQLLNKPVVDTTERTEQKELVEDLVQIITVFSCKLQGKRANKAKKIIKELTEND